MITKMMTDALIKAGRPDMSCARALRWPIVFLRVCCSICVRCSILILLIKTVRCSILILLIKTVRCSIHHLIGTLDIHTLHLNWTLGVLVVIFTSVSLHQDFKICYEHFFSVSGLMMLSSKSACICTPFAVIEHLQI